MSKVSEYLNEHLLGEVVASKRVRQRFSRDGSVLTMVPELVALPRSTNDIRKLARFSWQLAEKGHIMGLTMRGGGTDTTGGAIGKGVVVETRAHLNNILHLSLKEKFVHVQPGTTIDTVSQVLQWNGLALSGIPATSTYSTVGGALAKNSAGAAGTEGLAQSVRRLEVVLANGDILEVGPVSKRELNQKKGLQTFEGDIYRKLDALIEDNQEVIDKVLVGDDENRTGYQGISRVKQKDGSFDLTPLFIGNQGTLGIISEIVLNTTFYALNQAALVVVLDTPELARDTADFLRSFEPAELTTLDGKLYEDAQALGKLYAFFDEETDGSGIGAVVYARFNEFGERGISHKMKKVVKELTKRGLSPLTSDDRAIEELDAMRDVLGVVINPASDAASLPPLIDGALIPFERQEEFAALVKELSAKHHVSLPLVINGLSGAVIARPTLHLDQVGDKQKIFRLMNDYAELVDKCGGTFNGTAGEGRLQANAAWSLLDEQVAELYKQVKQIFDPYGILNPGVKQTAELRELVGALRSSFDTADVAEYGPTR